MLQLQDGLLAAEEQSGQPGAGQIVVSSHVRKNSGERSDADGIVVGNRDVVLAVPLGRQANMATGLTGDLVAEFAQSPGEVASGQIPRQSHAAKTSSRTKCRRITFGRSASSKWQRTASRTASRSASTSSASVKIECPRARATKPPSGASSTAKMISLGCVFMPPRINTRRGARQLDYQLPAQHLVDQLGVGLAAGGLHHLTDEPAEYFGVVPELGDLIGVGRDDLGGDPLDGAGIRDLPQALLFDDCRRVRAALE